MVTSAGGIKSWLNTSKARTKFLLNSFQTVWFPILQNIWSLRKENVCVVKIVIVLNRLKLVWLARWRFSIDTINNSRPFTDFSHDFGIKISVDFLEEIVQSWFIKQQLTFPRLHPAPGLWWHWTYRREPRGLGPLSQRQHMWNQELIKQNSFCKT